MKKLPIFLIALAAIFAGIFYLSNINSTDKTSEQQVAAPAVKTTDASSPEGLDEAFKDYSAATLAAAAEKGRTLLFFSAIWCPTCQAAKQDLSRNFTKLPEDLTILEVNYDTERALKKKYGVFTQHTFVQIDSEGNEITKWVGGGVSTILSNLEEI